MSFGNVRTWLAVQLRGVTGSQIHSDGLRKFP